MPIYTEPTMTIEAGGVKSAPFTIGQLEAATKAPRAAIPMKSTPDDDEVSNGAYRVAAGELRSFIERLDAEKKDIADQQKEVMAEATSRGYDTKVMRKLITMRKKDPAEISEEEAILELYREALGM